MSGASEPKGAFQAWCLPAGPPDRGEVRDAAAAPGLAPFRWLHPGPDAFQDLLDRLAEAGARLRRLPVTRVARTLGAVGGRFATEGDPLRSEALARLPEQAGLSEAQARWVLDGMARDWTGPRLWQLLEAEFQPPEVLDGFQAVPGDPAVRRLRALGPALAVHVGAGTVPGVAVTSLIRGLLVKGPVLLKPGAGDTVLPVLFARGLAQAAGDEAAALAAATAVLYWPGGTEALEAPALDRADEVVVYGGDDTVAGIRRRVRPQTRVVAYPHRLSVAVLGRAAWQGEGVGPAAASLARAVASFDQRGCVCPHQVFLPGAGAGQASAVARALAGALAREAAALPPGVPDPAEAAAVQQLRGAAELRAAAGEAVELHAGEGLAWTVVLDSEPRFQASCLARTVHVTPLPDLEALTRVLAPVAAHLQTVGLAGFPPGPDGTGPVAEAVAELGACRVVPLDAVPFPPPWWLHDGQGPLRALVRWAEWEP